MKGERNLIKPESHFVKCRECRVGTKALFHCLKCPRLDHFSQPALKVGVAMWVQMSSAFQTWPIKTSHVTSTSHSCLSPSQIQRKELAKDSMAEGMVEPQMWEAWTFSCCLSRTFVSNFAWMKNKLLLRHYRISFIASSATCFNEYMLLDFYFYLSNYMFFWVEINVWIILYATIFFAQNILTYFCM